MIRSLLILLTCLLLASTACAEAPQETFERANTLFEASVAKLGRDDRDASQGLRRSAVLFLSLTEDEDIVSSDLLTNAANALLLAGDTGEAISLYHRALRVDPADANARANLEVARTRASADAAIAQKPAVLDLFFSWRKAISPRHRGLIAGTAWAALWLWAGVCVLRAQRPRLTQVVLPFAAVAMLMSMTLLADFAANNGSPIGVVVVNESTGRTGPDAVVYDPSFTKPLPEGVEFTVLDQRTGWVLGRLGDGRETWLPVDDVQLVGI